MGLSKRPKGQEIEGYVERMIREQFSALATGKDWQANLVKKDLERLMAHLKLEFKDIESVPKKRVVTKATKKAKPKPESGKPVSVEDYLRWTGQAQAANAYPYQNYHWFWGRP